MEHKDLFSGIGGFALAARMVWGKQQKPRLFCEKEPYARKVLNKNFPGVPCVEDIHDLRGEPDEFRRVVEAMTAQERKNFNEFGREAILKLTDEILASV